MNAYVWGYVGNLTDNYHSGGGLLIVAHDLEHARQLFDEHTSNGEYRWYSEDRSPEFPKRDPDHVIPCECGAEALVMIFPDAGCC